MFPIKAILPIYLVSAGSIFRPAQAGFYPNRARNIKKKNLLFKEPDQRVTCQLRFDRAIFFQTSQSDIGVSTGTTDGRLWWLSREPRRGHIFDACIKCAQSGALVRVFLQFSKIRITSSCLQIAPYLPKYQA